AEAFGAPQLSGCVGQHGRRGVVGRPVGPFPSELDTRHPGPPQLQAVSQTVVLLDQNLAALERAGLGRRFGGGVHIGGFGDRLDGRGHAGGIERKALGDQAQPAHPRTFEQAHGRAH
ncbi:hypothetical protein RZS08_60515, partial [Arthrospira platensis SPKY1]|nr:hypothetical protein [Arthrospira platensis SPKY1]